MTDSRERTGEGNGRDREPTDAALEKKVAIGLAGDWLFLVLFFLVVFRFGITYCLTVSVFTTLFQVRRNRNNTVGTAVFLLGESLVLVALSHLAVQSLFWCLLINALVPLVLVFFGSTQFAPKGYFAAAMMFVFHQMRPAEDLPEQLVVVVVCWAVCMVTLFLVQRRRTGTSPPAPKERGLTDLVGLLEKMAQGEKSKALLKECFTLEETYHRLAYQTGSWVKTGGNKRKQYDILALLFQRSCYLIADPAWKEDQEQWQAVAQLKELAVFLAQSRQKQGFSSEEAEALLERMQLPTGRLCIYVRSILRMMQLFWQFETQQEMLPFWDRRRRRELWGHLRRRASHNRFEKRFALRLAVILVITFSVNVIFQNNHMYWLPMHAFLLLQPSFEECTHRMMTRPVGTVVGCVLVTCVDPFLVSPLWQAAFAFLMISLMYCSTPGEWVQPIFSTGYALTMASLSMPYDTLPWLRIGYLLLAIFLVILVNGFCFPVTKEKQFAFNLQALAQIQASYWAAVQSKWLGYGQEAQLGGLLNQFHMIYRQAMDYAMTLPNPRGDLCKKLLVTAWYCFSEAEQIAYDAVTGAVLPEEQNRFLATIRLFFASSTSKETLQGPISFSNPDLKRLMERYQTHRNEWVALACQNEQLVRKNMQEKEVFYES